MASCMATAWVCADQNAAWVDLCKADALNTVRHLNAPVMTDIALMSQALHVHRALLTTEIRIAAVARHP